MIEFSSSLFDDFAEVMSHATQSGADVLITVDADTTLTLANIKLAALATDDFRFAVTAEVAGFHQRRWGAREGAPFCL